MEFEWQKPDYVLEKLNSVGCGFCLAKWTQVTMHLGSGLTHSCHHPKAHPIDLNDLATNPGALHNTGFKKNVRKQMLRGERPGECDYCWRIEDNTGMHSDRTWKSRDPFSWPDFDKISKMTGDEDVYPRYVEVSFSNVCNFKCGYCGPAFSSKWTDEINEHGPYMFSLINWRYNEPDQYQKQIPNREHNPYIEAFWKWFPEAVKHMHTFRITGGEPLMSKHTIKVMDHLLNNPQPKLELSINSNACPPGNKWKEFVDKVKILEDKKCISKFVLFVSAESEGSQAEYNRFGMDWKMFTGNIEYFLKTTEGNCSFMSAFNVLSIPSFYKFLKYVSDLKDIYMDDETHYQRILVDIPYVRSPGFLDAKIATHDLVKKYLYPCIPFMKENKFDDRETQKMIRIVEDLDVRKNKPAEFEKEAIEGRRMFYEWIQQYDKRRGTDFVKTFPEMDKFYEDCKACMI